MKRLLFVFGKRENNLCVVELLSVELKLAHFKCSLVVYNAQRICIRAHFEPIDVGENALCTKTEASLAFSVAVVASYGKVVEHLLQIEACFVVGELYLSLVEELNHHLDVRLVVIAAENVLQKLTDNRLARIILCKSRHIDSAAAGIHIVEIVFEQVAFKLSRTNFPVNFADNGFHTVLVAGSIFLEKIAEQLFYCFIALTHYKTPLLRAVFWKVPHGRLIFGKSRQIPSL